MNSETTNNASSIRVPATSLSPSEGAMPVLVFSSNWNEAVRQLWDLRDKPFVSREEWEAVVEWLLSTTFDSSNFIAAETAAALIAEKAPLAVQETIEFSFGAPPRSEVQIRRRMQRIQPLISTQALSSFSPSIRLSGASSHQPPFQSNARRSRAAQIVLSSAPLLFADLLAIAVSHFLIMTTFRLFKSGEAGFDPEQWRYLGGYCLVYFVVGAISGLFPATGLSPVLEIRLQTRTFIGSFVSLLALNEVFEIFEHSTLSPLLMFISVVLLLGPLARTKARVLCAEAEWWGEHAIVVERVARGSAICKLLEKMPERGLKPIGIVSDSDSEYWLSDTGHSMLFLGTTGNLSEICRNTHCRWVLANTKEMDEQQIKDLLHQGRRIDNLVIFPQMESLPELLTETHYVFGGISFRIRNSYSQLQRIIKRALDVAITLPLLTILSPLFACICALMAWKSRGPILYGRTCIGRHGKSFRLFRFRTMQMNSEWVLRDYLESNSGAMEEWQQSHKLKEDPRIIPVIGGFLRRSGFDMLPQLFNVLRGEMSLIGPQPILDFNINGEIDHRQFLFRPGIYGMWRSAYSDELKQDNCHKLDSFYARNWSLWLDYYLFLLFLRRLMR